MNRAPNEQNERADFSCSIRNPLRALLEACSRFWAPMQALLSLFLIVAPDAIAGGPEEAERFTHFLGIHLADTPNFDDIAKKFGVAPVRHLGDAGDSDSRVCYRTVDGKGVFEFSHGEVYWGYVFRRARSSDTACPESNTVRDSQLEVAGITLGMSKERYRQVVGAPKETTAAHMKHEFHYVHAVRNSERWDVRISLNASFNDNKLTSIAVDRVETN